MNEMCISVDNDDKRLGPVSKKTCHLNTAIKEGLLHRAFSVFLFNNEGKLLLQQRSAEKITFPNNWTNTCCSHPLYSVASENTETGSSIPQDWELEEKDNLGIRRAAQRKLWHELGIRAIQVPIDSFRVLTKIHYKALNASEDGIWGEHEIDYILFIQKDVKLEPRENEVKAVKWVSKQELDEFVRNAKLKNIPLTPWFCLVHEHFLTEWWTALLEGNLDSVSKEGIQRLC